MALEGRGAACCYLCLQALPPRAGNEASGCSAFCADPTQHGKLLHGDCCARSDTCPICAVAKSQPSAQSPALRLLSQGGQACVKALTTGTSDEQHKADTRLHTLLTEATRLAYKQDDQVGKHVLCKDARVVFPSGPLACSALTAQLSTHSWPFF